MRTFYKKYRKQKLIDQIRDSDDTDNDGTELFTLKVLTILYMGICVASLHFLDVYNGKMDTYETMLKSLRLELDWQPVFDFAFTLDFNFVFSWPTDLSLRVQLPMSFSLGLLAFERLIAILWFINQYME